MAPDLFDQASIKVVDDDPVEVRCCISTNRSLLDEIAGVAMSLVLLAVSVYVAMTYFRDDAGNFSLPWEEEGVDAGYLCMAPTDIVAYSSDEDESDGLTKCVPGDSTIYVCVSGGSVMAGPERYERLFDATGTSPFGAQVTCTPKP